MLRARQEGCELEAVDPDAGRARLRVFINYRRADTSAYAGRLADSLIARFGADSVFMDIDTIPLGADFRDVIDEALNDCDVVLALIGRDWLQLLGSNRRRRTDNTNDYVRLELEAALRRPGVLVVPILVQDAEMPPERTLPPSLAPITFRNNFELSDRRWRADVETLCDALEALQKAGKDDERSSPADIAPSPRAIDEPRESLVDESPPPPKDDPRAKSGLQQQDEQVLPSKPAREQAAAAVAAKPATEAAITETPDRRLVGWSIAALALVVVIIGVVVAILLAVSSSGTHHAPKVSAPSVTATIALPAAGDHVAFARGAVFVTGSATELFRIDPATNNVAPDAALAGPSHAIATDGNTLWVSVGSNIVRADASRTITSVGANVHELTFGDNALWCTTSNLVRIDPATARVDANVSAGPNLDSVAASDGAVWVANRQASGTVTRVDPTINRVIATIPAGDTPDQVATGAGALWVANSHSGNISRIDPATNTVAATITIGGSPVWVVVGLNAVWVTDDSGNRVVRINPANNTVTGSVSVGQNPEAATIGAGSVWVVNRGDHTISRINPGT
jgi:YVTN family beta-propeller protein